MDFRRWSYINADLTISFARMPVGEWILLDAQTWLGGAGSGIAFSKLGDERGYFGRAIQSLVIEPRESARRLQARCRRRASCASIALLLFFLLLALLAHGHHDRAHRAHR